MKIPISARKRLHRTGSVLLVLGFSFLAIQTGFAAGREKPETGKNASKSQEPDSSKVLPNGIEVRHAGMLLQVLALRDDVLRVRLSANGVLPEDASWAVPPEIRRQHVEVTPDAAPGTVGFHTKSLSVRIEPSTLKLSTSDLSGNILQEDAEGWPAEFHSDAYRVFKKMPRMNIILAWVIKWDLSIAAARPSASGTRTHSVFRNRQTLSIRAFRFS